MTDVDLSVPVTQTKLDAVRNVGAEMVVTTCRQCVRTMPTCAKRTKTELVVKDLTELVVETME